MNEIKTVKIHCISRAISPLTHNSGTSGNETVINREYVYHNGAVKQIPVISGNAIRHKMIREPGAMYLIKQIGLYGKANVDHLNFLFNGGSLTKSSINDNMKRIAAMQTLLPLCRLLGGSLSNQIISGSLIVKRGVLICEENRQVIQNQLPDGFLLPEESLQPCENFIGRYQYTRGDARHHKEYSDMHKPVQYQMDDDSNAPTNLMIYSGQAVLPGACFYHGFILQNVSKKEVGALLHSLQIWSADGGTIGGSSRIGHGQLEMGFFIEPVADWFGDDLDVGSLVTEYIDHVEATKVESMAWLAEAF